MLGINVGLVQDTPKCSNRYFVLSGHDCDIDTRFGTSNEFYVTAFWLVSTKPTASTLRLTSLNGCGLSRANLNLD